MPPWKMAKLGFYSKKLRIKTFCAPIAQWRGVVCMSLTRNDPKRGSSYKCISSQTDVREAGVSRHHRGQIEDPLKLVEHPGTMVSRPIMSKYASLLDSRGKFCHPGIRSISLCTTVRNLPKFRLTNRRSVFSSHSHEWRAKIAQCKRALRGQDFYKKYKRWERLRLTLFAYIWKPLAVMVQLSLDKLLFSY